MKNDNNLEQALRGFVEDGRELTVDDYEQLCAYIYVSLKGKYCVAQGTMATDLVAEAWTRFIETWDPDKSSACTWISSCAWSAAHRAYTVASKTPDQDSCVSDWASNMQPQCDPWAEKERKEELELVA
jgi:hypothetical protein